MNFTRQQILLGVTFLKEHNFYEMFCQFKIPNEWHQSQMIKSMDQFQMIEGSPLLVDMSIVDHGHDDITFDIADAVGINTYCELPCYLYQLLCYCKKIDMN